jgi:diadenosine tetraphosphatase ApaH/serine/threonine PP2A family protein phosphatase
MTRWAIGDVQGCYAELDELLQRIRFKADRDLLLFTGDLVNRGPQSLATLRRVRNLAANAIVVLGNHDLHLLAVAFVPDHRLRRSDTLDEVLEASDRESLLAWLLERPLAHYDSAHHDLVVHAGLVPQWHAQQAAQLAGEVESALRHDPRALLSAMYGDEPDRWDESLSGEDRLRFIINVLTRVRVCTAAEGATGGKPCAVDAMVQDQGARQRGSARHLRPLVDARLLSRRRRAVPRHGLRLGRGAHGSQPGRPRLTAGGRPGPPPRRRWLAPPSPVSTSRAGRSRSAARTALY